MASTAKSNVVSMPAGNAEAEAAKEVAKSAAFQKREAAREAFAKRARGWGELTAQGAGSLTEMAITFQAKVASGDLTEGDGTGMYKIYAEAMNAASVARRGVEAIAEKSIGPAASTFATFGFAGPASLEDRVFGIILTGEKDDDGKPVTRELNLYDFIGQVRSSIAKEDLRDGSLYAHYAHVNRGVQDLAEGIDLATEEGVDALFALVTTDWLKAWISKDVGAGKTDLEKFKIAIETATKINSKKLMHAEIARHLEHIDAIMSALAASAKASALADKEAATKVAA